MNAIQALSQLSYTPISVSYTHLDVYKRQVPAVALVVERQHDEAVYAVLAGDVLRGDDLEDCLLYTSYTRVERSVKSICQLLCRARRRAGRSVHFREGVGAALRGVKAAPVSYTHLDVYKRQL